MPYLPLPPRIGGYQSRSLNMQNLLHAARNMLVVGERVIPRPGYRIYRKATTAPSSKTYMERLPVDQSDGTLRSILHYGSDFVQDVNAMTSLELAVYDPYGSVTSLIPSWVHMLGRLVWVADGTEFRIVIHDGSSYLVRIPMDDPNHPTPSATTGGSMTPATWNVAVRYYDSKTKTYTGPDNRLGGTTSATTSGGNLALQIVQPSSPPSRATHWQIQLTSGTDTPANYSITTAKVSVGGALASDAAGLIPIGTTTVYVDADPSGGLGQFQFRTIGAQTLYRHSNPPPAHFVTHFRGHAFYAAADGLWLIWSEADNPEHFYHNTTDPASTVGNFNNLSGESLMDAVVSPCTGLGATEDALVFFTRSGIVLGIGTWVLIDERRDARTVPVTQNTVGNVGADILNLDDQLYFMSQEGPKVFAGGVVPDVLDNEAVRLLWESRDRQYEHRTRIGYLPRYDLVLFAFVSKNAPLAGVCDVVLAWHRGSRRWSAPIDASLCSMTLHRLVLDDTTVRGTQLIVGMPYGTAVEFGVSHGDGWDGSDADKELTASSYTATTADVSGKSWSADVHIGRSIVLEDKTTGRAWSRFIKDNDGDTITWDGNVTNSGGGWTLYIGGIRWIDQLLAWVEGSELCVTGVTVVLDDQLSRLCS